MIFFLEKLQSKVLNAKNRTETITTAKAITIVAYINSLNLHTKNNNSNMNMNTIRLQSSNNN